MCSHLAVCVSRRRPPTCLARRVPEIGDDHRNHAAPQRKPNPASQKSHLTKTLLWTCKLFRKSDSNFADFLFVGRSVGNSRVCRVKSFEIQQSTRIDRIARNPYTLPVKKKDLRNYRSWRGSRRTTRKKTRSKWRLGGHTSPFQTGGRSRNQKYPSLWGVTAENSTNVYFTNAVPFFPWEQHLLGADDRSFRRWCWDGQETRNVTVVGISNQTIDLSFSSPTKKRTDSWSTRKTIRRSYLTLWKDSWKKAWRKTIDKHPPAKPTHFKGKQSFSLMNSSSLGWVIAKR